MAETNKTRPQDRVFCSYSSADRSRVTGLGLLLEGLGHQVFLDHKTIKPGVRWEARLQQGLDQADVLLVYWSKSASRSEWVRKEIEYFHINHPDRPLVPVLGDETPLSELLKPFQHADFCPLINELLELKKAMEARGVKPAQIHVAIMNRLSEAGIDIEQKHRKKLLGLFAGSGFVGLLSAPTLALKSTWDRAYETLAQITWGQALALGIAVASGASFALLAGFTSKDCEQHLRDEQKPTKVQTPSPLVLLAPESPRVHDDDPGHQNSVNQPAGQHSVQLSGTGTLVAPGWGNQAFRIHKVDASQFARGNVTIEIAMGNGKSGGSFDLFAEDREIPVAGYPGSLAHTYDLAPGGKSTLSYDFSEGQIFQFGATGNWFSDKGATNTFGYEITITGERDR